MKYTAVRVFDPRVCHWLPIGPKERESNQYPKLPSLPVRNTSDRGWATLDTEKATNLEPRILKRKSGETRSATKRRILNYEAKVFFNCRVDINAMMFSTEERRKAYGAIKRKGDWSVYDLVVKKRKGEGNLKVVEVRSGPEIVPKL